MGSDLALVIIWWFYILIMGIIFLPVAKLILCGFFDKGYLFSKTMSILAVSYLLWFLSSLRILPFSRIAIFSLIFGAFVIIHKIFKGYKGFIEFLKENKSLFIAEEILFLAGLVFWCYIRGLQPDIYGLEKFMDFGFVNTILKTEYMPPQDMWLAGNTINYYYYGHYICAFLTKLTSIDSAVSYNIMIATIFSFTMCTTFSLGGNIFYLLGNQDMKKVIIAGVISSMLLTFGGNLHGFVYAKAVPFAKSIGLYKGNVENYFYADATRYIGYNPPTQDKTIHEFPFYSFVVSDLHGHVSNIPFVLTILAVILSYIVGNIDDKKTNIILAFMLAAFYMTNAWDFPIYLTVALFAMAYKKIVNSGLNLKSISGALFQAGRIFILSQFVMLFYILSFKNMAGGIGFVHSRTPFYQLFILWGYQFFLAVCFVIFLILLRKKEVSTGGKRPMAVKIRDFITSSSPADIYVLILLVSAFGLVAMPEVIYVMDIYGPEYHRANTMFKLVYQSFIMIGVSAGYIVVRIISSIERVLNRRAAAALFIIILLMPMIYPYYAVKGYYGSLKVTNYKGLYGLKFLERSYPDDYEAVKWLNRNVTGQEVVLEASGEGYTDYERLSMATGLPTVLGWFGHEWLWRGGPDIPNQREQDIKEVYESTDILATMQIIRKYDISYIAIGKLERDKYKDINDEKLLKLGEIVFDSQGTKLVKVKR